MQIKSLLPAAVQLTKYLRSAKSSVYNKGKGKKEKTLYFSSKTQQKATYPFKNKTFTFDTAVLGLEFIMC